MEPVSTLIVRRLAHRVVLRKTADARFVGPDLHLVIAIELASRVPARWLRDVSVARLIDRAGQLAAAASSAMRARARAARGLLAVKRMLSRSGHTGELR